MQERSMMRGRSWGTKVEAEQARTTYEIWVHSILGEFAVRLEDGHVTGIRPISLRTAMGPERLQELEYESDDAALYRVREHPEQFFEFGPTLQGRYVPVHSARRWGSGFRWKHRKKEL
jgi:hypothetical protein